MTEHVSQFGYHWFDFGGDRHTFLLPDREVGLFRQHCPDVPTRHATADEVAHRDDGYNSLGELVAAGLFTDDEGVVAQIMFLEGELSAGGRA